MTRYLLPVGIFAAILMFLGIGLTLDPSRVPSPLIGKPAPEFSLSRLHDASALISHNDLKGHVSLLNIWATWCVSCRVEHPVLMNFARRSSVPVYGLNYKDDRSAAIEWLVQYGNPYVASAFDESGKVAIDWGVYGAPETFVIDKQGIVRYKHIGPLTEEVIAKTLNPLIASLRTE